MRLFAVILNDNPHDLVVDSSLNFDAQKNESCYPCHILDTNNYIPNSSIICLECHDGVIAKDRVINFPGSSGFHAIADRALRNGHPISVEYKESSASLRPLDTPIYDWHNAKMIADLLRDGKIECVSCHEAHNSIYAVLLRHEQSSGICTSCHDK